MQHALRYLFLAGGTLLTGTGPAAEIQQVSSQCTTGCNDRCVSGSCQQGNYCHSGQCFGDRCNVRSRHEGFCLDWCGRCGPIGRVAGRGCPTAQKLCWCCKTKASCDSGWAPPARLPVNRTGGWYQAYWPGQWYGNPGGGFAGGAPVVYQPTDTTQLGYSYNRVPTWRPNPGMIPRVPRPSSYHTRRCPGQRGCQTCPAGYHAGTVIGTPVRYKAGRCSTCNPGYVNMAAQQPAPQLAQTQPPPAPLAHQTTAASTVLSAQPITAPATEESVSPTAGKSVRPVSRTVTKQTASAGPRRPGKRASRTSGSAQRRTKKTSGGWFGLPSLNKIKIRHGIDASGHSS